MNSNKLGDYIERVSDKNTNNLDLPLVGININKEFIPSVANIIGTDLSKYKIINHNNFAFNPMHVGRDEVLPVALYKNTSPSIISPAFITFKIKNNSNLLPEFLELFLKLDYIDQYLTFRADASVRGGISWDDFCSVPFELPSLVEQKKIISLMNNINKNIMINNQINDNLYELGNKMFSSYASSCNDTLKATDYLKFERGTEPGSNNYSTTKKDNMVRFIRVGDMENVEGSTYVEKNLAGNISCKKDNVLLSLDASIGRTSYGIEGCYSTGVRKVESLDKKISNGFIYYLLNSNDVQEVIRKNATGTTILHAGKSLEYLTIPFNKKNIEDISKELQDIFNFQINIKAENEKLSKLRDTLLPKLMNGEIDLENIEI